MRSPGSRRSGARVAIRHPIRYLVVAALLGIPHAWMVVTAAHRLPWTRGWASSAFTKDPWDHAVPFALACATLAWTFRARIAGPSDRSVPSAVFKCALFGGPVYLIFLQVLSLVLVPQQVNGLADALTMLVSIPLAGALLGGLFGALLLPLTLPLTWGATLLLRVASGGPRSAVASA